MPRLADGGGHVAYTLPALLLYQQQASGAALFRRSPEGLRYLHMDLGRLATSLGACLYQLGRVPARGARPIALLGKGAQERGSLGM